MEKQKRENNARRAFNNHSSRDVYEQQIIRNSRFQVDQRFAFEPSSRVDRGMSNPQGGVSRHIEAASPDQKRPREEDRSFEHSNKRFCHENNRNIQRSPSYYNDHFGSSRRDFKQYQKY